MNEFPEFMKELFEEVEGKNDKQLVSIFTLSTCMWCKKCKAFLNDRNMKYRYIDVDKIDGKDKSTILNHLRTKYESRISYPFLVCESGHVIGYNPNQYEEIFKK